MNNTARASAMLMGLAMICPAAPSQAGECRLGPVTIDAPVCKIEETPHSDGPARYVQWEEGGIRYEVSVIAPYGPGRFRGHVSRWRRSHKCTAEEIPFGRTAHFPPESRKPAFVTWKGVCADCGRFVIQAMGFKRRVVEFHAGRGCSRPVPASGGPGLEDALAALLDRVQIAPSD
jgi:hypothetical protein